MFSLPGKPDRGTAASRWAPERTTTPPGSCWLSGCLGWDVAGAPGPGGVYWRSWMHSWVGGCGPSPSAWGLEEDTRFSFTVRMNVFFLYLFCLFCSVCMVDWPSCLRPWAGRWGTVCVSSWGQWRAQHRWPHPGRTCIHIRRKKWNCESTREIKGNSSLRGTFRNVMRLKGWEGFREEFIH